MELIYLLPQANNTLQQNPCEVTGLLEAQCGGYCGFESASYSISIAHAIAAVYELDPLGQGETYFPPQKNDSFGQTCDCNTVIFRYDVSPYA